MGVGEAGEESDNSLIIHSSCQVNCQSMTSSLLTPAQELVNSELNVAFQYCRETTCYDSLISISEYRQQDRSCLNLLGDLN